MDGGSADHPLRADPLHTLPDAVPVVRRASPAGARRVRRAPASASVRVPARRSRSPPSRRRVVSDLAYSGFEKEAVARVAAGDVRDPLFVAVAERADLPAPAPAGRAFATRIEDALAAADDVSAGDEDGPLVAAGVVDRSDVSLFPAGTERGGAAGVFVVRSRRNWAFGGSAHSHVSGGAGEAPSSPEPLEPEYYFVRRAIADFVWLEGRLRARYDGIIVPPLPAMALAGRLQHGYAYEAERLRGLERFLRRVATHAVLSTGDEVLAFLGATGEEAWLKLRHEPISHEGGLASALPGGGGQTGDSKEQVNAFEALGRWGEKFVWKTGRQLNKSLVWFLERDSHEDARRKAGSAEARLERLQVYVEELGASLSAVRNTASRVASNRHQEMRGLVKFQDALRKLGSREGGSFGSVLENVTLSSAGGIPAPTFPPPASATGAVAAGAATTGAGSYRSEAGAESHLSDSASSRLSVIQGMHAADRALDEVLGDFEERSNGAKRIMNARRDEQEAYEHALDVYTKLRDQLESRTGSMWETSAPDNTLPSSGEGLEELCQAVNAASTRLAAARKQYQAVAVSTTDELRRLRTDMHDDLCAGLHGVAVEYARQHAAHARAWMALAAGLDDYREVSGRPPSSIYGT